MLLFYYCFMIRATKSQQSKNFLGNNSSFRRWMKVVLNHSDVFNESYYRSIKFLIYAWYKVNFSWLGQFWWWSQFSYRFLKHSTCIRISRLKSFYCSNDLKKCLLKLNICNIYLQSNLLHCRLLRPWSW